MAEEEEEEKNEQEKKNAANMLLKTILADRLTLKEFQGNEKQGNTGF